MGRYLKATSGEGSFEQAPSGSHVAVCIGIVDIGTQTSEYQGEVRKRQQVLLRWELSNELMSDGQPYIISAFYTASLHEKSKLRHVLEAWRGRPFTDQELEGFDLNNILGKPCMLSIIHTDTGKARVSGVMALPKGTPAPKPMNPCKAFWIEEWNEEAFQDLSDGIKRIIQASDEYSSKGHKSSAAKSIMEMTDDIPF